MGCSHSKVVVGLDQKDEKVSLSVSDKINSPSNEMSASVTVSEELDSKGANTEQEEKHQEINNFQNDLSVIVENANSSFKMEVASKKIGLVKQKTIKRNLLEDDMENVEKPSPRDDEFKAPPSLKARAMSVKGGAISSIKESNGGSNKDRPSMGDRAPSLKEKTMSFGKLHVDGDAAQNQLGSGKLKPRMSWTEKILGVGTPIVKSSKKYLSDKSKPGFFQPHPETSTT